MGPKASSPERALILDSSAILAAMLAEPSAGQVLEKLDAAFSIGIAAPTLVEAAIVLSSKLGKDAMPRLNEFLREAEAEILPFGPGHVDAAVDALLKYGKGRHPAGLNFSSIRAGMLGHY